MAVEVRADHLVEDARVDDDADPREDGGHGRRDHRADGTRDVAVDHQDGGDRIDDGDDAENGERRPRHSPEPLAIGAQRGPYDVRRPRPTEHLFRDDGGLVAAEVCA